VTHWLLWAGLAAGTAAAVALLVFLLARGG
jgi:hypothetical protein